jgi:hypothetical protein
MVCFCAPGSSGHVKSRPRDSARQTQQGKLFVRQFKVLRKYDLSPRIGRSKASGVNAWNRLSQSSQQFFTGRKLSRFFAHARAARIGEHSKRGGTSIRVVYLLNDKPNPVVRVGAHGGLLWSPLNHTGAVM